MFYMRIVLVLCFFAGCTAFCPKNQSPIRLSGLSLKATTKEALEACKNDLFQLMEKANCNPIMIRLAWHDAGTYDDRVGLTNWPKCGGANGSIRFDPELSHGANSGLTIALNLLKKVKKDHDSVGWADLLQMASAVAIEHAGGPRIPMKYGRLDAANAEDCTPDGRLPGAAAPFGDGAKTPGDHLRNVFYRMGLGDMEIVALSGAHTLGRAWKNRSGFGAEKGTKFTTGDVTPRADGKPGYGSKGGSSWTEKWLKFDNSYFTTMMDLQADPELLKLETDLAVVAQDDKFKSFTEEYARDQSKFFVDYIIAHKKLSELGAKFDPPGGISL